jgi:hypothetical protein
MISARPQDVGKRKWRRGGGANHQINLKSEI